MSTRLALAGLFTALIASLAFSSSTIAASIDVTPTSASVAPGEVIQFRADPDQSCWRPNQQALTTPVYRWTITDASSAVIAGPTNVVGTDFVAGLLTIPVTAPQNPGTYSFNWTGLNECANDPAATASFVVTGTATTTTTTTTTIAPTTTAATTTAPPTTVSATTTIAAAGVPTTAAVTTTDAVALPATGRTTNWLVWAALITLLMGGGMVAVAAQRT